MMKKLKQEDVDPDDYLRYARGLKLHAQDAAGMESARKHQELALVYKSYQRLLRLHGMIDFEDQVTLAVELFRSRPSVLKEYQERYKYILVDEFQDTNHIQFELLKLLSAGHNNITVVGDDDQSIFRFRGASLSNILSFGRIYPQAERVVINTNYRSTQPILDAAYRLIRHNDPDRLEVQAKIDKSLHSVTERQGKSIHMMQFDTLSHESDRVVDIIREQVLAGRRFRDIAILVRTNADADPFLRAMNMRDVPFRFSGSRGLYAQTEIKILTAFIRAVCDFDDSRSLYYLALSDIYRMSAYDLTILANYAHKKSLTLHKIFRAVSQGRSPVPVSDTAQDAARRIFRDLMSFVNLAARQNAGQVIYAFLHQTGYLKNLAQERTTQAELRIKNIRIFFDKVKKLSEVAEDDSLLTFAKHLELLQQVGDDPASAEAELEEDAVNVLTVHKAKGLEFPVVFMVALIADRYPGMVRRDKIPIPEEILKDPLDGASRDPESPGNVFIQEERRLFYVGMTRAKQNLYLTWARDYGLKRLKKVSPFVLEALDLVRIPEEIRSVSPREAIECFAPPSIAEGSEMTTAKGMRERRTSDTKPLALSFFQVDDYLTCPLKYHYRHVVRIPVLPHYNLVYGRVLHASIHFYLQRKMEATNPALDEALAEYRRRWVNEGFLSREHEEMKKAAGERALRLFVRRDQKSPWIPELLEKPFKWQDAGVRFSGRWDRVDRLPEGWVITDFKAAEVKNQEEADRRARHSLQLDIYALSFQKVWGTPPLEMRLHFLESDILGRARSGENEFRRALKKIAEAEHGIRSRDFSARPDWHNCNQCDFKTICPSSYAY